MTEMRFLVGDVVRLVSGSPSLTVTEVCPSDPPVVVVEWAIDGVMETHAFPVACLRLDGDVKEEFDA